MDDAKGDPDAFIEADLDFHLALAEAAANALILSLIDSIVGLLREQRISIFKVDGGPERGQYHHKRILEAIENRDPAERAKRCARTSVRCEKIPATPRRKRITTRFRFRERRRNGKSGLCGPRRYGRRDG